MQKVLLSIAKRFWPQLETMPLDRQVVGVGEVIAFLYAAPMAVAGLAWLVLVTDWAVLKQNAAFLLLLFVLNGIFYRLRFFLIVELRTNRYGSADGSMAGIVLWSAIFILGPVALWLSVVWFFVQVLVNSRGVMSVADIWNRRRNLVMSTAGETLVPLTALWLYREWGGEFGFADLSMETMLPAFEAIVVYVLLSALLWAGYFGYNSWIHKSLDESNRLGPLVNFFLLSIGLPQLALPFAILAASLYIQNGLPVYVFFMGGMLVVAFLTRRLSLAVESGRQQFRVLEKLEQLGRAIIMASPTPEALPEILRAHIPNMFPSGKIVIWIFPDNILFKSRQDWHPELDVLWPWLLGQTSPTALLAEDLLPWQETAGLHNPVIVAPIVDVEGGQPFAGVLLELHTLAQPWDRRALNNLMPAVKSLTDQIASAIHQSEMAEQTLEFERVTQELRLAGSIQSSLLPYVFPEIPGWELAVSLSPAGEMAGDFFDIIPLQDGKIGIVIADVLDKGLGPALYMALSRTLIRTYATEFDLNPDTVFFAANDRILKDTRANLFVTVFYGVLDPATGTLMYSNAGHNPPFLFDSQNGRDVQSLDRTGIPIGIDEDTAWKCDTVNIEPGDCLVLYTDGIPEAENGDGEFFEEKRLLKVIKANLGHPAEEIQAAILKDVHLFLGDRRPGDDITLMVLLRDK